MTALQCNQFPFCAYLHAVQVIDLFHPLLAILESEMANALEIHVDKMLAAAKGNKLIMKCYGKLAGINVLLSHSFFAKTWPQSSVPKVMVM